MWTEPLLFFAPFSLFSFHFNFSQVEKDQSITHTFGKSKTLRLVFFAFPPINFTTSSVVDSGGRLSLPCVHVDVSPVFLITVIRD